MEFPRVVLGGMLSVCLEREVFCWLREGVNLGGFFVGAEVVVGVFPRLVIEFSVEVEVVVGRFLVEVVVVESVVFLSKFVSESV